MNLFISWSGELSMKIAAEIKEWIPLVLQAVKPYYTPDDIEKGTRWNQDVAKVLYESDYGILCITQDNMHSNWLLFEAGALSKHMLRGRVVPLLINVKPTDLSGPLSQFQAVSVEKNDFFKMIKGINSCCTDIALSEGSIEKVFNQWWPQLNEKINNIIMQNPSTKVDRTERELIEEILSLSRTFARSEINDNWLIPTNVIINLVELLERLHGGIASKADHTEIMARFAQLKIPVEQVVISASNYDAIASQLLETHFLSHDNFLLDTESSLDETDSDTAF